MATRVNTRFVFLLAACIVALVGAIGAFYVLKVSRSAEQLERQGDELLAAGDTRAAMDKYGRAIHKDPNNDDLLEKYAELVERVPAKDILDARTIFAQITDFKRLIAEARPDDEAALDDFLGHLLRLADDFGQRHFIDELHRHASAKLSSYPENKVAQRYLAIAQARRLTDQTPREEAAAAADTLRAALEADPGDAQAARHLAYYHLFEIHRLGRINAPQEELEPLRERVLQLTTRMAESAPDNLSIQLSRLEMILQPQMGAAPASATQPARPRHLDEVRELMVPIEQKLLADPQPTEVARLSALLQAADATVLPPGGDGQRPVTSGVRRSELLVRAGIEKEPDSVFFNALLARFLQAQGKLDEASALYAKVWEARPQLTAERLMRAEQLRIEAGIDRANLLIMQADPIADPGQRDAMLSEAEATLKEVETIAGENGRLLLVRGKAALARRQWVQAMQHIDRSIDLLLGTNHELEATLLSAHARQRSGEPGAATEQLERLVQRLPQSIELRLQLAQLYAQTRQFTRAQEHVEAVLRSNPRNADATMLQGQVFALQNRVPEAIAAFETLNLDAKPEAVVPLAALYLSQNQGGRARELLQPRFEANPTDTRLITALLRATPDAEARRAILAKARAAGAEEQAIRMLDMQVDAQAGGALPSREELIEQVLDAETDPTRRALTEARIALRTNEAEKAKAVLAAAEKTTPGFADDPNVLELRFELALNEKDWATAENIALRGASLNMDQANGAFLRATVALAKGNLDEAAAHYRQGLTVRPVYSEGWRRLGDVQLQLGDHQNAKESYERAIEQRPDNVPALRGRAAVADAEGDRTRALQLLRDALPMGEQNPELIQVYLNYESRHGDKARALEIRRRLAQANPGDSANRREIALLLAETGKADEAVALLESQIAEEGATLPIVAALAQVHGAAGDFQKADNTLTSYIAARGGEATSDDHIALGRFRLMAGDIAGAIAAYEPARAMEDPETRTTSRELADLLFARGATEQALVVYEDVYRNDESDAVVGMRLAETLLRLGRDEDARPLLEKFGNRVESKVLRALVRRADAAKALRDGREDDAARLRAEAITLFEDAIRSDTNNQLARVQLATTLLQEDEVSPRVRTLLDEALRINPEYAEARFALADVHLREGRINDAIREVRIVVDQQPRNAQLRGRLAELYLQNGDRANAELTLRDGAKQDPENPLYPQMLAQLALSSGNQAAALVEVEQEFKLNKSPDSLVRYASLLIAANRAADAEKVLQEHIDWVNEAPVLQGLRGLALAKAGRSDEARALFPRAVQRATTPPQLNFIAQQMQDAFGREEAISLLTSTSETIAPEAGFVAGQMELRAGRHADAARRLAAVLQQLPADHALRLDTLRALAIAQYESKDYPAAAQSYASILEQRPNDVATLNNLAYLYVEDLRQPEKGLPLAERAARMQPGNAQILDTLGWAQGKVGQLREAEATLRQSVAAQPIAAGYYHLAAVLKDLGNTAEARECVNEAIRLAQQTQDEALLRQCRELLHQLGE